MHRCMASTFKLFDMRFCKKYGNLIRFVSQVIFDFRDHRESFSKLRYSPHQDWFFQEDWVLQI